MAIEVMGGRKIANSDGRSWSQFVGAQLLMCCQRRMSSLRLISPVIGCTVVGNSAVSASLLRTEWRLPAMVPELLAWVSCFAPGLA